MFSNACSFCILCYFKVWLISCWCYGFSVHQERVNVNFSIAAPV